MAKLNSLIRVQKHRVVEKQKILARLYAELEALEQKKQDVIDQIAKERKVAEGMSSDPLTQLSFGNYINNAKKIVSALENDIEKVNVRVSLAQDDIRAAFEELKKTEIVHQNRIDEEKKAQKKKENTELDEIGIEGHRRSNIEE